jgi:large subunit ribosomal protein L31
MPKDGIHPKYYPDAKATCVSCGATFTTGSTQPELKVEVCSNCHPFYTGKEMLIDTGGQIQKYEEKVKKSKVRKAEVEKRELVKKEETKKEQERPRSLRELLES